jgi:hypothetical protein
MCAYVISCARFSYRPFVSPLTSHSTSLRVNSLSRNDKNEDCRVFGYAAKPISEKLRKKGGELIIAPEGFFVKDVEGPLKEGELERAAAWAREITAVL